MSALRGVRRRVVLAAAGVLVLLLVATDVGVRSWTEHRADSALDRRLGTSSAKVSLGTTPVLLDLARDRVGTVSLSASDASLCRLSGIDIDATLHDLTVRGGRHVASSDAEVTLGSGGLTQLAGTLVPGSVTVTPDPSADTLDLSAGGGLAQVAVRPTLRGTRLSLTPTSATILGRAVPASTLHRLDARAPHRDLGALPMDLSPTTVRVTPAGLRLSLHGGAADLDTAGTPACGGPAS